MSHYTRNAYFERSQRDATPPPRAPRRTLADCTLYALACGVLVGMVAWGVVAAVWEMADDRRGLDPALLTPSTLEVLTARDEILAVLDRLSDDRKRGMA